MINHRRAGFSLMEMAIILIIMGIIAGTTMPTILRYREQAKFKETKDRQEQISHAVGAFAVINNRTPCPADPNAHPAKKGMEREHCSDIKSAIGLVPYRDLGLSESFAKDGYGRSFTYIVPPQFRAANQPLNVCKLTPIINIEVKDQHGVSVNHTSYGKKNPIVLAIISQSPKSSNNNVLSESDIEKTGESLIFYDTPFSLSDKNPSKYFIKWVTGQNLITFYGKGSCENGADKTPVFNHPLNQNDRKSSGLGDPFGRNH